MHAVVCVRACVCECVLGEGDWLKVMIVELATWGVSPDVFIARKLASNWYL